LARTGAIPSQFSTSRRTIFVIHGYLNSGNSDYMISIKDAILNAEDANVFLVDWRSGANSPYYPSSAANTRTTGAEVGFRMNRLVNERGLSRRNLWCIGFSLGAHTCGFAGMYTQIERVTGLDPAGPWFDGYSEVARLNPRCGNLVDVMHTDGTGLTPNYGLLTPIGDMDFYPNGGTNQPNCLTYLTNDGYQRNITAMDEEDLDPIGDISVSCSHMRAVKYFEKSTIRGCFNTRLVCWDQKNLPRSCNSCSEGICGEMGFYADRYSRRGLFYLETSGNSPWCRY